MSVPAVLDGGFDAAQRVAAPWFGVLWLTGLPYRLLLVHLVHRLLVLGADAGKHGGYVRDLALLVVAAFVVAVAGRTVFARACALGLEARSSPGWNVLVPRWTDLAGHLVVASILLVTGTLLVPTILGPAVAAGCAYLGAAACTDLPRGRWAAAFERTGRALASSATPIALVGIFSLATLLAAVNVYFGVQVLLWLAGGVVGTDLAAWSHLLSFRTPLFLLLVGAAAVMVVEPFWIAASVVVVHVGRSRTTGEDLRHWFLRLAREEAA